MSLRHTATLVRLAAWYLMMPPKLKSGVFSHLGLFRDKDAPLNEWTIVGRFDTARQCEAAMDNRRATPREGLRCIHSDDPRLVK